VSQLRNSVALVDKLARWRELLDQVGVLVERLGARQLEHDDAGAFAKGAHQELQRELDEAYIDAVHDRTAHDLRETELRAVAQRGEHLDADVAQALAGALA